MNEIANLSKIAIVSGLMIGGVWYERNKLEEDRQILMSLLDKKDYTGWDFAHFFLHFNIGLNAPQFFWISLIWSVGWEYVENKIGEKDEYWKDSDKEDYILNTSGLVVGLLLNNLLKKT